jgi:hypothetical protein
MTTPTQDLPLIFFPLGTPNPFTSDERYSVEVKQLTETLRAGDLSKVYRLVTPWGAWKLQAVMLYCGFSMSTPKHRHFARDCQTLLAAACRARCDGFGLRSL